MDSHPWGKCHLCQAPDTDHTDLSQDASYPASFSLCQDAARAGGSGETPPPLCRLATGLVGWEISHTWDGPKSQSRQGQGNQQPLLTQLYGS